MNKKGVINQLQSMIAPLIGIAVVLAVGFLIFAEIAANDTVAASTNASAAIETLQLAMDDIPGWLPIIIVALIGAVLLGLVRVFRT